MLVFMNCINGKKAIYKPVRTEKVLLSSVEEMVSNQNLLEFGAKNRFQALF